MQNDRLITISYGNNRRSTNWRLQALMLSELWEKLRVPIRSTETLSEYLSMKKAQQDELKDVGGYIGGTLSGSRRKAGKITGRDVITLDFDNVPPGGTEDVLRRVEGLGVGYCVHSTRKHHGAAPRLRVLIPFDRTVSADEYEPCARKIAERIGLELTDSSTFETSRLMYWPSCCSDSQYVYHWADKPFVSADGLLAQYSDWHDTSLWPALPGAQAFNKLAVKQGDPESKTGVVGAFCRTYDIYRAIDELIPGIYEPVDNAPDRYTYLGGSTTGGAVVYDGGKFLYSHHATDPCGGKLVNAFDLVRLHRFGELDDAAAPEAFGRMLPSYKEMCKWALADKNVSSLMAQEDFADAAQPESTEETDTVNWAAKLTRTANGLYDKTYQNVALLLEYDPNLRGRIKFNTFAEWIIGVAPLPWGNRENEKGDFIWSDSDDSGLKIYVEQKMHFRAPEVINVALSHHFAKHCFNPVTDYLDGLLWDRVPRLGTLFSDYLGAANNDYNRLVTKKSFVAAVARAYEPGVKYDVLTAIISTKEGIGKSTLLYKMAKGWFNDNMISFEGNKASEALQGAWLVEVAELHALNRTDIDRIKQFLSQREDIYRRAYGRRTEWHPRRCVFFGTGNDAEFINTATGGRRFLPITAGIYPPKKNVFKDLDAEIDQIWAEAVVYWKLGEPLYLSSEQEKIAAVVREDHRVIDPRSGDIIEFVEREVPENWLDWPTEKRVLYWASSVKGEIKTIPRQTISAAEIWCELFGQPLAKFTKREAMNINSILKTMPEWEKKGAGRVGALGKVTKYFERKKI